MTTWSARVGLLAVSFSCLPTPAVDAQTLVLTELMARNATTLVDADGDSSDWIEVYNVTDSPVNLDGWSLTDDAEEPRKWLFPGRDLTPRTALLVFASGKDRRPVDGELHAGFKLSGGGEFLGLFMPTGELASAYAPGFPDQFTHASYGFRMTSQSVALVAAGAAVRYHEPLDDMLGKIWTEAVFDDALWDVGTFPVGFDGKETATFGGELSTDLGAPDATTGASLYLRTSFAVADPAMLDALLLRIRYDDGFVAYLNGAEVARGNSPREPGGRSAAATEVAESRTFFFEIIDVSGNLSELKAGENVLAIHALNSSAADPDLLIMPELEGLRIESAPGIEPGYFENPTPGWPNGEIRRGVASEVTFSVPSRISAEPFLVKLETSGSLAEIRYTTDRTEPDRRSPLYTGPLTIDRAMELRARSFVDDLVPGDICREMYALLAPDLVDFTSDLPLVVFNSVGRPDPIQPGPGQFFVLERAGDGRTALTQPVELAGEGRMWARGSSTLTHPKKAWRLEFRDLRGEDLDLSPLGMPADGDWLLYGAHIVDPSMLRNAFMYELSNQMERYAVRGRFCEVFLNGMSEPISRSDYVGVYSFFERIERHEDRVDVERLGVDDTEEPDITGGYILKIDRGDADEKPFEAGGRAIAAFYPATGDITDAQLAWIKAYLDAFAEALELPEVTDGSVALDDKLYAEYIDVDSWVDHHLLNEFALNSDGLNLSTYLFKPRGEKLAAGPIWDFDRAVGAASTGQSATDSWQCGQFFGATWWNRLFLDPQFWLRYRDLYLSRRATTLSEKNVRAIIEQFATEINEAQVRNFDRWGRDPIDHDDWRGEVDFLAEWVSRRLRWMDTRFVSAPGFDVPAGTAESGIEVTFTRPLGNMAGSCDADPAFPPPTDGEIYYTLNGPDPRGPAGSKDPEALLYDGAPVVVEDNVRIRARALERGAWSDLAEAGYVTTPAALALTEIMYNPAVIEGDAFAASNFEYLELLNVGDEPISLVGFALNKPAVEITDSDVFGGPLPLLGPGEYFLLVRNPEAFQARYPASAVVIAGRFGSRDTLSNGGQELLLTGPFGEEVFRFEYGDEWQPTTDGPGHSLVLIDAATPRADYGVSTAWRASGSPGGSPGLADSTDVTGGRQRRGDFTQDGRLNIADPVALLGFLFRDAPGPCSTAPGNTALLDVNGDGRLNVTDAVGTLDFIFGRANPPAPGIDCVTIEGCPDACAEP